jgi:hypothetical protein
LRHQVDDLAPTGNPRAAWHGHAGQRFHVAGTLLATT